MGPTVRAKSHQPTFCNNSLRQTHSQFILSFFSFFFFLPAFLISNPLKKIKKHKNGGTMAIGTSTGTDQSFSTQHRRIKGWVMVEIDGAGWRWRSAPQVQTVIFAAGFVEGFGRIIGEKRRENQSTKTKTIPVD